MVKIQAAQQALVSDEGANATSAELMLATYSLLLGPTIALQRENPKDFLLIVKEENRWLFNDEIVELSLMIMPFGIDFWVLCLRIACFFIVE